MLGHLGWVMCLVFCEPPHRMTAIPPGAGKGTHDALGCWEGLSTVKVDLNRCYLVIGSYGKRPFWYFLVTKMLGHRLI